MNISEMMEKIRKDGTMEKVAAQGGALSTEDQEKTALANDLWYSGKLMGHALVEGMLEKVAEPPAGASGKTPDSKGNTSNDKSNFKRIADKVFAAHGMKTPGTVPSIPGGSPLVVAEKTAPQQVHNPNPNDAVGK
jgi:hypothetical protein